MKSSVPCRRTFLKLSGLFMTGAMLNGTILAGNAPAISSEALALLGGITWLGNSSFRIQDGDKVIYIDPYALSKSSNDADIILICHPHSDHCEPASVKKVFKSSTQIITEPESAAMLKSISKDILIVKPGDETTVDGIQIKMIPSYTIKPTQYPHKKTWLGFLITLRDGRRIYHAGETDLIPEMSGIQCDVAMLPCVGIAMMIPSEVAEAVKIIKPKITVPIHWGSVAGSIVDAQNVAKALEGTEFEVYIFKKGESIAPVNTAVTDWNQQ